jgi:prepilin-type N-terminal cleavage/methylation domain-containing protein/prepilin-type processing-associated H-X9-DG protein
MEFSMKTVRNESGFTLIELLVVIAIIAVLMGILMPALRRARQQAQAVVCKTRLKDIGLMMTFYMADNDDNMVSNAYVNPNGSYGGRWTTRLGDYYDRRDEGAGTHTRYNTDMIYCPVEWKKRLQNGSTPGFAKNTGYMYDFNRFLADTGTQTYMKGKFAKSTSWRQPSALPLLHETNSDYDDGALSIGEGIYPSKTLFEHGWNSGVYDVSLTGRFGPATNHGRGINYLFADMHVETTMWPFLGTMDAPEDRKYYYKNWHPRRNLDIKTH